MAEKIFKERFCEIKKIKVCTTSSEMDFNSYTEPGTYEIYEDIGNDQSRVYFLAVDKSAGGHCTQTRTYCGKIEYRNCTASGEWTEWESRTGGGGSGGSGEDGGYYIPSLEQIDENTAQMTFTPSKGDMPEIPNSIIELPSGSGGSGANIITLNYGDTFNEEEIYNAYNDGALILLRGRHEFESEIDGETINERADFLIPITSVDYDDYLDHVSLYFVGSDNYGNGISAEYFLEWHLSVIMNAGITALVYDKQDLTDEQKTQARANIGAISIEDATKLLGKGGTSIDYDCNVRSVNHRGYSAVAPENTIPAYILSKQMGFTYVECDVAFTSDNVAVLLHDNTIDRTSDGSGSIASMTYETASQYDFGSWKSSEYAGTKIPTFEEFIMLCKSIGLHPYIELKSSGAYTEEQIAGIVSTVKAYGMEGKVTYISFNSTFLEYVKTADSKARLGYLADITTATIATAVSLKTEENEVFMDVSYSNVTSEKVAMCIEKNLPLEIWTVNDESIIANMDAYVTGVTSDNIIAGKVLYDKYITFEPTPEPETGAWVDERFYFDLIQGKIHTSSGAKYLSATTERASYVGTACTLIPGDRYRLVGQAGVRYGIHTITQSGLAKVMNNMDLILVGAGQNNEDKLDSGWVTTGYTFIADANAACAWLTSSFTSGDIVPEQAMPVYIEHLGKKEPTLLYNWDLTTSLTDTVSGVVATTTGQQDAEGLVLTELNTYCDFGAVYGLDRTYELDVVRFDRVEDEHYRPYARVWGVDTDVATDAGGSTFCHTVHDMRKGWRFYCYNTGGWCGEISPEMSGTLEDGYAQHFFDGRTLKIYVDTARYATLYVDNTKLYTTEYPFPEYVNGHIYIGGTNDCAQVFVVSGLRVYDGLHID